MKRRHFLQFSSSTLAALGLSEWEIHQQGITYAQAIAQVTPRKLALLVGINQYPENSQFSTLQGCVTDVELQRQLLIHRFGFQPQDILTLTDRKATRQNILTAFEEHLIKQAKSGDVVVFHYSGHGSQVSDPDRDAADGLNSTFVPVDSVLPANFPTTGGSVKDIMGHTLFLLMSALQTENVTAVLDSCHSGGGTRGSLRVRSRNGGAILQADPAEVAYQQQWLARLQLTPAEFIRQRRLGVAKGVVIAAAKRNQLAADTPFSDFYAGAFTYLMTQYLWQQTGSSIVRNAIPSIARSTTKASSSNQEPQFEVQPGSDFEGRSLYFTAQQIVPAEAVITNIEGNQAVLWLGGLDPQSLVAFDRAAILTAVGGSGSSQAQVKLESRSGLVGRGKLINAAKPGVFLQEQVRGIPTDLKLRIGLDPALGNETNRATQALQAIRRLEILPLQRQAVDYILGRMTAADRQQSQSTEAIGSLGLFSPGLEPVPGSFGAAGEAITIGVDRLQAKFKSLLAAKIVKLTLNTNSSKLKVAAAIVPQGSTNQLIASSFTVRGTGKTPVTNSVQAIPLGTALQIQVTNNESSALFFTVLVIDAVGEMTVIFPNQWTASADVMKLAAGQTLQIPDRQRDSFQLVTQAPKGTTEVLIIGSSAPLGSALKALQSVAARGGQTRGAIALADPTDLISSLLADLDSKRGQSAPQGIRSIDTSQFAALSLTFDVV